MKTDIFSLPINKKYNVLIILDKIVSLSI